MSDKAVVVLAAGKGKRMKSDLPKVLHRLNGQPMITRLLDTLVPLDFKHIIVVIGHQGELVQKELHGLPVEFTWQREQLGTAHAVKMASNQLKNFSGITLVVAGDVPFLSKKSIERLFKVHVDTSASATCLSAVFDDPTGYGRIVRDPDGDHLVDIIEHADASEEVRAIREINSGTFCFDNQALFEAIESIDKDNAQGEYYLTDAVKVMRSKGLRVSVVTAENPDEVLGVNSVQQLEALAAKFDG